MPLSFRQAGNLFIAGPNINIYPSGNTYAISGSASGSTIGIESISTIGTGIFSIASSVTNNNLVYRTLSGAGGFGIIDNGLGTLTFTSTTSSTLSITYVSGVTSAGTGNRLLLSSITNNNLIYKSISAGTGIGITESNNTLIFSASSSSSGTIISGTNVGTGTGIFCGLTTTVSSNDTLAFYNLSGGPNFSVSLNDNNEIFVDRGSIIVNSFRNEGGGARILSAISSDFRTLSARTISGIGFNIVTATTNVISIRPTNTTASRLYITDSTNILTTSANFGHDSTNGNIGVGTAAVTTTRLLIGAGSASLSQLRLTKFSTNPSSPTDGDIWYATSGNTLKFVRDTDITDFIFKDNNISLTGNTSSQIVLLTTSATLTTKNIVDFSVFSTISSLTISNTASETSIISSQLVTGNTKTLLASNSPINPQLIVGRKYRFNAKGTIQTTGSVNLTLKMKFDSSVIANTGTLALTNNIPASTYFEVDLTFTIRTTGATGTVIGSGKILSDTDLVNSVTSKITNIATQGEVTIDTTSNKTFDVTAQFGTANSNNKIEVYEATLEYLN